jgi:hypothetical protein
MSGKRSFGDVLAEGFMSPAVRKSIEAFNRPAYEIGDGTAVVLGDHVRVPERVGRPRGGQWGEVVRLSDGGLGIRFREKVAGITREFFEWDDLNGARATAVSRKGKRLSILPPVKIS